MLESAGSAIFGFGWLARPHDLLGVKRAPHVAVEQRLRSTRAACRACAQCSYHGGVADGFVM